jgi:hypothetical protein
MVLFSMDQNPQVWEQPYLSHVNEVEWMGEILNGHGFHDMQGSIVSHLCVPLWRVCCTFIQNAFFPSPSIAFYISFFVFSFNVA